MLVGQLVRQRGEGWPEIARTGHVLFHPACIFAYYYRLLRCAAVVSVRGRVPGHAREGEEDAQQVHVVLILGECAVSKYSKLSALSHPVIYCYCRCPRRRLRRCTELVPRLYVLWRLPSAQTVDVILGSKLGPGIARPKQGTRVERLTRTA